MWYGDCRVRMNRNSGRNREEGRLHLVSRITIITQFRSDPGRPTIKESKRCFVFSVELCAIAMIPNPNRHSSSGIYVELEFAMFCMPLNLNATVAARNQLRRSNTLHCFEREPGVVCSQKERLGR